MTNQDSPRPSLFNHLPGWGRWAGLAFFACLLAIWRLGIHQTGWLVPAVHDGDGLMMLQWIDTMGRGLGYLGDPRLGFPGIQDLSGFPRADWLHLGILSCLGKMGCPTACCYNLYLVAGFTLSTWSATACWYLGGCPWPRAAMLGLLFAFLPWHFQEVHHLFLASYFLAPWQVMPALRLAQNKGPDRWLPLPWEFALAFLGGLAGLYTAWFASVAVLAAGCRAGWLGRTWKTPTQALMLAMAGGLAAGTGWLPALWTDRHEPANPVVGARLALESEVYSLQPLALALPHQGHLSGLGLFRAEYMGSHRPLQEAEASYLGVTACAGLLLGLLALVTRTGSGPLEALGFVTLVCLAYAMTGGLGAATAWVVPGIRVLGRMSLILAFLGLTAWALLPPLQSLPRWQALAGLTVWLLVGLADQFIKPEAASPSRRVAEWAALGDLGQAITQAYPEGGKHFQLPWHGYPEGIPPGTMDGYGHLAAVLHAPGQTFSAGGMMNTPADAWQRWVAGLPVPQMLAELTAQGMDGLWVDTRGYPAQKWDALRSALARHLAEPVEAAGVKRVWYDLRTAHNLPATPPCPPLLVLIRGVLLEPLGDPTRLSLRIRGSGAVRLHNPGPAARHRLVLRAEEGATLPGGLILQGVVGGELLFQNHQLSTGLELELPANSWADLEIRTLRRWLRPAPMPLHDAAVWLEIHPISVPP